MLQLVARWCLPCCAGLMLLVTGCTSSTEDPTNLSTGVSAADPLPSDDKLKAELDEVLDFTERRILDSKQHAAWQIMHGILAYGQDLQISDNGQLVPAIDWLLNGGTMVGWNLVPDEKGLVALVEVGTKTGQGHADQWLAVLAQSHVPYDHKLIWEGQEYKFGDLVTQAQWDMYDGKEASWSLIGLGAYLPLDAEWESKRGDKWTFDRIVDMESDQELATSACGGSHRLIGLAMTLNRHKKRGGKMEGAWAKANEKIQFAIAKAQEYQQPDGSFSTNYFSRSASSPDVGLKINTSGHTFEFLSIAMTDEQLKEPWMVRAAESLCTMLELTKDMDVECGALYHAAHGLQIYRLRRFGPARYKYDGPDASEGAKPDGGETPDSAQVSDKPAPGTAPVQPQAPAPPVTVEGTAEGNDTVNDGAKTSQDNSAPRPGDEAKAAAAGGDALTK